MGGGRFAQGEPVTTREGKPLSESYAQAPCGGDWDGDGDWDLVLGFINGSVKLYLNNGDFTFEEAGALTCDGKDIQAQDGGPCVTDWDGDGILDLLLGDDKGVVRFYKGIKRGSLELTTDDNHIVIAGKDAWKERQPNPASPVGFSPGYPGVRLKPYAVDWNDDGKLDLLVGDFITISEVRNLTPKEQKRLETIQKEESQVYRALSEVSSRLWRKALAAIGKNEKDPLSEEEQSKCMKVYSDLTGKDATYQSLWKRYLVLREELYKLKPPPVVSHGFVWVYLRK